MDKDKVLAILKAYAAGQATPAEFEAALRYLETLASKNPEQSQQYLPGGISCETAQAGLLDFLDPTSRAAMTLLEQDRLLQHLVECAACSQEFLDLSAVDKPMPLGVPQTLEQFRAVGFHPTRCSSHKVVSPNSSSNW